MAYTYLGGNRQIFGGFGHLLVIGMDAIHADELLGGGKKSIIVRGFGETRVHLVRKM